MAVYLSVETLPCKLHPVSVWRILLTGREAEGWLYVRVVSQVKSESEQNIEGMRFTLTNQLFGGYKHGLMTGERRGEERRGSPVPVPVPALSFLRIGSVDTLPPWACHMI